MNRSDSSSRISVSSTSIHDSPSRVVGSAILHSVYVSRVEDAAPSHLPMWSISQTPSAPARILTSEGSGTLGNQAGGEPKWNVLIAQARCGQTAAYRIG